MTKREYQAKWRKEHPDYNRDWQKEHADKARSKSARYRINHPEEESLRHATYRQEHPVSPEVNRMRRSRYRAQLRSQFVEDVDPQTVYEIYGGMCGICLKFIEGDFHVDHVIPISKGGLHCYANVQAAHPICNLRKGNRKDELTNRLLLVHNG